MKILFSYLTLVSLSTIFVGVATDNEIDSNDYSPGRDGYNRSSVDDGEDQFQRSLNVSPKEEGNTDRIDSGNVEKIVKKSDMFNKIIQGALKKPGTKQKLDQLLPVVRTMTPAQKLALATMVMNQLMGNSGQESATSDDGFTVNKTRELLAPVITNIATAVVNGIVTKGEQSAESAGRSNSFPGYLYNPFVSTYRQIGQSPPTMMLHHGGTRRFQRIGANRGDDVPPEMMPPPPSNYSYADYANIEATTDRDPLLERPDSIASAGANDGKAECTLVNNDVCLETSSYPDIEILESISNVEYRHMFKALSDDTAQLIKGDGSAIRYEPDIDRREENGGSFLNNDLAVCKSKVRYARPKKARSMNGQWKFVVNTAEYAQTIRLETCVHLDKPCSYLTENVASKCTQIFNYHRLLTWDETNGLSLDIFKIPTCCSCHIESVTPFLPEKVVPTKSSTTTSKLDTTIAENAIIVDELTIHQPQLVKPNRFRNKPTTTLVQQSTPKRELMLKVRRPPMMQHQQQQPAVVQHQIEVSEARPHLRYMTVDATIRKPPLVKVTNQRMNDNGGDRSVLLTRQDNFAYYPAERTIQNTAIGAASGSTSGGKVNYNYHPIIDFFKSASSSVVSPMAQQQQQQEQQQQIQQQFQQQIQQQPNERMDTDNIVVEDPIVKTNNNNNWMPITANDIRATSKNL